MCYNFTEKKHEREFMKPQKITKNRIWELDFIRGLAIIGVVFVHTVFDINYLFRVFDRPFLYGNPVFDAVQHYGSLIFIILSGICVTLGSRNIKRGLLVFGGGTLVSAATYIGVLLGLLNKADRIDFGILSCLGLCMLAYSLFADCNKYIVALIGIMLAALGYYLAGKTAQNDLLAFLGYRSASYSAGDYFPFIVNFGYFLIGAFLGRTFYADGKSLLPFFNDRTPVINIFCLIGRNTLWIYLVHQPVVFVILLLFFPMR